jgi:uncharacterized protein
MDSKFLQGFWTVGLLAVANVFMLFAWYGHLRFKDWTFLKDAGLVKVILISWGIALVEYCLMIPANRIGYRENGGPFSLVQLKVIQEVLHLALFAVFVLVLFKGEELKWNHAVSGLCLIAAVYFAFRS